MTYFDWKSAFLSTGVSAEKRAMLWNLEGEGRIDEAKASFLDLVVAKFDALCESMSDNEAAEAALEAAIVELRSDGEDVWLNRLKNQHRPDDAQQPFVTHIRGDAVPYYSPGRNPGSTKNPAREIEFRPSRVRAAGKRHLWLTFRMPTGEIVSSSLPTTVARELGLPHFGGQFVYRVEIDLPTNVALFIPTVLDAGLYAAWSPPVPLDHPWGLTRDLEDGSLKWPELLLDLYSHEPDATIGVAVSPAGDIRAVGDLKPDWMASRQ